MIPADSSQDLIRKLSSTEDNETEGLKLRDGSRVAVIGGGPAGSFFSYFFLSMAERVGLNVELDIYEPRDFSGFGPSGCNHCGGIISESLVQHLATEGISIPDSVVQRGIDSYVLHMAEGDARIDTPSHEKRIAAVFRGSGPRGTTETKWQSFDGFLQGLALQQGARVLRERVSSLGWEDNLPLVTTAGKDKTARAYELVIVAVGVNSVFLKNLERLDGGYAPPKTTKTFICEFRVGEEKVLEYLGSSMHVFLLNLPRLEFAALIPKGDHITLCLLGEEIDGALVKSFLGTEEVKRCFPGDIPIPGDVCHCSPKISVGAGRRPFLDRVVMIGDCGVTRLYKDGIGAAYRTAKAAARTAIFEGISERDFERHYWPALRTIKTDNTIGKFIFALTGQIQTRRFARRAVLRMTTREQQGSRGRPLMSSVLWDVFTGSAPYRDVLVRTLRPDFLARLAWNLVAGGRRLKGAIDP